MRRSVIVGGRDRQGLKRRGARHVNTHTTLALVKNASSAASTSALVETRVPPFSQCTVLSGKHRHNHHHAASSLRPNAIAAGRGSNHHGKEVTPSPQQSRRRRGGGGGGDEKRPDRYRTNTHQAAEPRGRRVRSLGQRAPQPVALGGELGAGVDAESTS